MNNKNLFTDFPIAVSSLIVISIFLTRLGVVGGFDPSFFILASEKFVVKEEIDKNLKVFKEGYDGQFYYRYALNPFSKDLKYGKKPPGGRGRYGIKVDSPKYRRGRLLYRM